MRWQVISSELNGAEIISSQFPLLIISLSLSLSLSFSYPDNQFTTAIEQCDQMGGYFWKFFATNFLTNVAQIFGNFLGYFEKVTLKVETAVSTFIKKTTTTLIAFTGFANANGP